MGSRGGVAAAEVVALVEATLRAGGLSLRHVVELATVEARAAEPGIVAAAARLGVPLRAYPAELLAGIVVPNPSDAALGAVGTPSVAEAAALAGGGELLVLKRTSGRDGRPAAATCAVARRPGSGPDLPSADSVVAAPWERQP